MKTMIAVPCMDTVHTAFFRSYNAMAKPAGTVLATCQSSLVYDSRNRLAQEALASDCGRVLWLDSDMELPEDLMRRLSEDLDEGRDYVSALAFRRNLPTWPVLYDRVEYESRPGGKIAVEARRYTKWPEGGVFEIAGSGFGAVMMTTELLRRVAEEYTLPFAPMPGLGEDLAFCWKARQLGYKLWCDPRVLPGHVGVMTYDGRLYRPEDRE